MTGRLLAVSALIWTGFAGMAVGQALSCSATISNINFGQIAVGSPGSFQTTGTVSITCARPGGGAGTVEACIDIGPGSGGASGTLPSISTRFMTNPTAPGSQLGYALRRTPGGPVWNSERFTLSRVGSTDTFQATATIHATIVTPGSFMATGVHSSSFTGVANAALRWGNNNCGSTPSNLNSFTVGATVTPSCTVSTDDLAFGLVSPANGADASAAVRATCSAGASYSVGLGFGHGPGVTDPAQRRMTSGMNTLTYGLYRDAARTLAWGNQTSNRLTGQTGTGSQQVHQVFGRVPPGQSVSSGNYADTVVVTVEY